MPNFVFFDTSFENLGVQILSALLKENNYNCKVVYEPADHINASKEYFTEEKANRIVGEILGHNPDVVGFSAVTDTYQFCCQIARKIKKEDSRITIIFGGCHPTIMGKEILQNDFIDFSIVGEGELALLGFLGEFCNGKNYGRVNNLCYKQDGQMFNNPLHPYLNGTKLDSLPFPDKDIYFQKNEYARLRYMIMTSRGCNFRCTYCANNVLKKIYSHEKNHIRKRSPENVISELLEAKKRYNIKCIWFMDDVFTADSKWLKDFSWLYKEKVKLPAECNTHPSLISEEIADMLREMNMRTVALGIQTADEEYRKKFLHRFENNEKVETSVEILKKRNIKVTLDHIIGLPNETFESIKDSIVAYSRWKPTLVGWYCLTYYPKTEIIETAKQFGVLDNQAIEDIYHGKGKQNYMQFHIDYNEKQYLRYAILIRGIGFLPGFLIRFLANHIYLVIPSRLLNSLVSLFPRWVIQRQRKGAFALIKLLIKNKLKR